MTPDRDELAVGSAKTWTQLTRMFSFIRGQKRILAGCTLLALLQAGIEMSLPLIVRQGVDSLMMPKAPHVPSSSPTASLLWLVSLYLFLLLANLGISYTAAIGLNFLGQTAVHSLRLDLWRHLHKLPVSFFDSNPVGRLVTRVTNDSNSLIEFFSSILTSIVSNTLVFVGVLTIMLRLDVGLSLRLLALAPCIVLVAWQFQKRSVDAYRAIRRLLAQSNTFLQETITGAAILKCFGRQTFVNDKFKAVNRDYYQAQMRVVHLSAVFRPAIDFFQVCATGVIIFYGGSEVLNHRLSVGTWVAFFLYLRVLFSPLQELAEKFNLLQSSVVASERLFKILDTPAELSGPIQPSRPPPPKIVFDQVSFGYSQEEPVLRKVSFTIAPGKMVAVVGPTGSGKTTLASLLMRYYDLDPSQTGKILVDDVSVHDWNLTALRKRFSYVPQDMFLFSGTIRKNINLFEEEKADRFSDALKASRLAQLLKKFPHGVDHELNERGSAMSQGERQLIAFARALNHGGDILVLDEATAHVDVQTEALLQQALRELLKGRTSLIIAHRLSTVQEADLILVLKKGQIVEQGRHEELLAHKGLYAHLYATQFTAHAV